MTTYQVGEERFEAPDQKVAIGRAIERLRPSGDFVLEQVEADCVVESWEVSVDGEIVAETWLSVPRAARRAGYSEEYIRQLCRDGKLRSVRPGGSGQYRIREDWLQAYTMGEPCDA